MLCKLTHVCTNYLHVSCDCPVASSGMLLGGYILIRVFDQLLGSTLCRFYVRGRSL